MAIVIEDILNLKGRYGNIFLYESGGQKIARSIPFGCMLKDKLADTADNDIPKVVVRGSIGPVVSYMLGGQNIVRAKPSYFRDKKSDGQMRQRNAFSASVKWYQALSPALKGAYPERLARHSGFNVFMSNNINKGITGSSVKWDDLTISNGSLENPEFKIESPANQNDAHIRWTDDSDGNTRLANDKVVLVFIEPGSKNVFFSEAYSRASSSATISLPAGMKGKELQVYAYVKRADGSKASVSKWLGSI